MDNDICCRMREALEAIASTKNGNFWKMRAWCERHDLYMDDLSDERAWVAIAEKVLASGIECSHMREIKKLREDADRWRILYHQAEELLKAEAQVKV